VEVAGTVDTEAGIEAVPGGLDTRWYKDSLETAAGPLQLAVAHCGRHSRHGVDYLHRELGVGHSTAAGEHAKEVFRTEEGMVAEMVGHKMSRCRD
jgi:hypothetical protein